MANQPLPDVAREKPCLCQVRPLAGLIWLPTGAVNDRVGREVPKQSQCWRTRNGSARKRPDPRGSGPRRGPNEENFPVQVGVGAVGGDPPERLEHGGHAESLPNIRQLTIDTVGCRTLAG